MPIDINDAFESVKFKYRNETDPDFMLYFEYHQTNEYGPTITIHNLDTGAFSLPVSAYVEAVDYLRSRGTLPGGPKPAAPVARPGNRLSPTRVTAGVGPAAPTPQRPQFTDPASYASQASLLAGGAVESWSTRPPSLSPEKLEMLKQSSEDIDIRSQDPEPDITEAYGEGVVQHFESPPNETEEGLDPSYSLANAQRVRQEGKTKKPAAAVIKRRES